MTLSVLDSTGTTRILSTTVNPGDSGLVTSTAVTDSLSGAKLTVSQLHNSDQQSVPGTANSAFQSGVAQLQDPVSGLINRQREAGQDNVAPLGISAGATNYGMQFKTTTVTNTSSGSLTMTLVAVSGTVGGVPWAIRQGSKLTIDSGGSQETLTVQSVNTGTKVVTFTAVTAFTHNGTGTPVPVLGMTYNQGRDASGENDGATGSGTGVAVEYEFNGGDPSGGNFDRSRNINAKAIGGATISAGGGAGSSSLTIAAWSAGLQPGTKILLFKASTFPAGGSFESVNVDLSYVAPSTTVPLASPIVGAVGYDNIAFDQFTALGPGLTGFLPFGIGAEALSFFDPVTGKLYLGRSATADAVSAQNIVMESHALWNGATMDRQRGNFDTGAITTLTAQAAGTVLSADQTNTNGRGIKLGINITVLGASTNLTVTLQGKDTASGTYYTILASTAIAATGFTLLTVFPGSAVAANVSANDQLPRTYRIQAVVAGSNTCTATIGASVIL